jgi:hypothetical protein
MNRPSRWRLAVDWVLPLLPWLLFALLVGRVDRYFPPEWPWFQVIAGSFLLATAYCIVRLWALTRARGLFSLRGLYLATALTAGLLPSIIVSMLLLDRSLDAIAREVTEQLALGEILGSRTIERSYGFDNHLEMVYTLTEPIDLLALQSHAGTGRFYIKSDEDALLVASYDGDRCGHCQLYYSMGPNPHQLRVRVVRF